MSDYWSPWMKEVIQVYKESLRNAHRQGIAELLGRKDTVQEVTLESGQKLLVAYNQNADEEKKSE